MHKIIGFILFFSLIPAALAQKAPSCAEKAKTPLETVYCEIKEQAPSTRLPSLHEFRNNPPKTQHLLLRRPAKKLGITMPDAPKKKKKRSALKAASKAASAPPANTPANTPTITGGLADYCTLNKTEIRCDDMHYKLLPNLPNHKLSKGALESSNTFDLPDFEGDKGHQEDVIQYLKAAYTLYIEQMITIGLAATTMSFTKFYHTFMEVESNKVSFSARLQKMFDYLKKDKSTMGVKSRFNDRLPVTLDHCSTLSQSIIACDNVKQNWIFQKT